LSQITAQSASNYTELLVEYQNKLLLGYFH